jgi:hypothetical protein
MKSSYFDMRNDLQNAISGFVKDVRDSVDNRGSDGYAYLTGYLGSMLASYVAHMPDRDVEVLVKELKKAGEKFKNGEAVAKDVV